MITTFSTNGVVKTLFMFQDGIVTAYHIEWKIEEQYKKNKKNKDEVPVKDFRNRNVESFAKKWIDIHIKEFKRLGVTGRF